MALPATVAAKAKNTEARRVLESILDNETIAKLRISLADYHEATRVD